MNDREFQQLTHLIGLLRINSRGSEVIPGCGYKPDLTIVDEEGSLQFVLECEQKTDRKAFLGDILKAEKYSESLNANPMLVIVMRVFNNTTVIQISDHIAPYLMWLHGHKINGLHISRVAVISDVEYVNSIEANQIIGSPAFMERCEVWERPY